MLPISNSQNNVACPTSYQKVQWYNGSKPFSMEDLLAQSSTQTMLLNTSPFRQLAIKAREKSVSSDSWNSKKTNMLSSAAFPTSSKPLGLPWLTGAEPEQRNKESSTKPVDRKRLETHIKLDLDTLKGVKESVNRESASETNTQSEVKKLKPMKLQFFKTKMCPWVVSVGHCRKGASCRYAHSHEEIRPLPDLTKTKFCPRFTQGGQCKDGENCKYAHGYHELRATQSFSKTKLCPMWLINQCNVSGNMCRFAHGEQDLRPVSAGEGDQDSCYVTHKDNEFLLYSGPLPPSKCTEGCRGDSWSTARRLLSAETQTGCDNTVASIDTARTEFASPMDSSSQDGFTTRHWCSPHTTTTTTATTCGVSRQSPRTEPREMTVSESSPLIVPHQIATLEPTEKRESVTPVPHQMSSTSFNGAPELPCQPRQSNSSSLPHFLWATPSLGKITDDQKNFKDATSVTKDYKAKGPDMENGEAMSPCVTPVRVACRPAHSMDFTPTTQRPQTSTLRLPFSPLPLVWAAFPSACEVSALQDVQFSPHTGSVQIPSPTSLAVDRLIATSPTKTPSAIVLHSGDASKKPTIVGACVAAPPMATSAQPPTSFSCATVSGATQVPLSLKAVSSPVPQMNYAPQNLALWNLYPVTSPLTHKEHASARCASPITQATWDGWELPSQIRSSIEQHPPFTKQCFATPTPTFPFFVDSQPELRSQQVVPQNATSHYCEEGVPRKAPIQGTPEPFEDATNGGRSAHSLRPLPQPMSPTTQSAKAEFNQSNNSLLYTSGLSPTPSWFVASTPQHSRHGKNVPPQNCSQFSDLASSSFNEKLITASPITLQTGGVHSSSPHTTRYTVPPAANQPLNQLYLSPSIRLAASPLKFALPYASNYTLTEHNRSPVTVKYLQDSSSSLLPEFPFFPLRSQDDGNAPLRKKTGDGVDATTTTPAADRMSYGSPLTMCSGLSFTVQPNRLRPSLRPELEDAGNYCDFVPSPLLNAPLATPTDLPLGSSVFFPHNKVKYSTTSRLPNKEADEYEKRKIYASSARHHSSVDHCSASRLDSSEVRRTFSATPVPTPAPYWLSTDCSSNRRSNYCQNGSYDEASGKRSFYESLPSQVDPVWGPTFTSAQQPDGTCVGLSSALYRPASQANFELRNSVNLKQNSQRLSTANAIDAQPYHRSLTSASLACGPRTASIMNTPQGYLSPQSSTYLPPQQNCIGESSPGNQCSASPSFFSTSSPWTSRSRYPPSPHTTTATIYSHPHTTYHPLA